jgi:hypothetical protein
MASVSPAYFYEDQVFRVNKNGEVEFGLVTENWEMYSSDEDEEERDVDDKVPNGHVAVTWYPKNKDEVLPEAKVQLDIHNEVGEFDEKVIFSIIRMICILSKR